MLDLCTSLALMPYLLAAAYAFKLAPSRETYESDHRARRREMAIGAVVTVYTPFLVFTAGVTSCCCPASSTRQARSSTSWPGERTREDLFAARTRTVRALVAGAGHRRHRVISLVTGAISI